jgi:hypothetical protein
MLQRILAASTESVGLSALTNQLMLPAWNVSSTCPPIEQELVESRWLLLLAFATAVDFGEESLICRRTVRGASNQFHNLEVKNESGIVAGLIRRTAKRPI